jgi:integrase
MRALPHHLTVQHYTTRRGVRRTLYYVRFTDWKGIRRKVPVGADLTVAKQRRDQLLGQNVLRHDFDQDAAPPPGLTLAAWLERCVALRQHKRSLAKDRTSVRYLLAFFGSHCALEQLTTSQIEAYKQARLQQPDRYGRLPKPATINRELAFLRWALRLAADDQLIERLPRIHLLEEQNERDRTISDTEFRAIYVEMAPQGRPVLTALRETGMRVSEVLGLRWSHVSLTEGWFDLGETKNGKPRRVPLSPTLRDTLVLLAQQQATLDPEAFVFRTAQGGRFTRRWFHRLWQRACAKAGVAGAWVHDFRRTFSTNKLEEGWDRRWVMRITGHLSDSAFDRYNQPSLEQLQQVVGGKKH